MLFISIDDSSHQSASDSEPTDSDRRKKRASDPTDSDRRKKRVLIDVVQDEPNNDRFGMFAIVTD